MNADLFAQYTAIESLKARYCRLLDTKQWDAWTDLFTDDFIMDCSDDIPAEIGDAVITGRAAAAAQVRGFVGTAITVHQVHAPEITIESDTRATGIWAMSDVVSWPEGVASPIPGIGLVVGYGHYHETYRREVSGWKIASLKLTRLKIERR